MERLTKLFCTVNSNRITTRHFMLPDQTGNTEHQQKMVDKLGRLEDIEQELGIDLITFFKSIWLLDPDGKDSKGIPHTAPFPIKTLETLKKNYGKTWALTKEELENEKNIC